MDHDPHELAGVALAKTGYRPPKHADPWESVVGALGYTNATKTAQSAAVLAFARAADPKSSRVYDDTLTLIKAACGPLVEKIKKLEQELAAVKTKGLVYRGVFQQGERYQIGDACTRSGSLWICRAKDTVSVPGTHEAGWTLAVKSGAPGRDGKDLTR